MTLQETKTQEGRVENEPLDVDSLAASSHKEDKNFDSYDFGDQDFEGLTFRNCSLKYADLTSVKNLNPSCFSGSDITGARLPEEFKFDLESLNTFVKMTRALNYTMLLTSIYLILTAMSTRDVDLLIGSGSFTLPIVSIGISVGHFFLLAPILHVVLFSFVLTSYFKIFERIKFLPARFPNGLSVDEFLEPWHGLEVIRQISPNLAETKDIATTVRGAFTFAMIWFVPISACFVFWASYLPKHSLGVTMFHVGLIYLTVCMGVLSILSLFLMLRRSQIFWSAFFIALILSPLAFVSYLVATERSLPSGFARLIHLVGYDPYLSLNGAMVSSRPISWTPGLDPNFDEVSGAVLRGNSLFKASGVHVFLARADLRGANLTEGNFRRARFQYADLSAAKLDRTELEFANFKNAHLQGTAFVNASIADGIFERSLSSDANFTEAILTRANFNHSDLGRANFRGSYMVGATFINAGIERARFEGANLYGAVFETSVKFANFTMANLTGADFRNAEDLDTANFTDACGDASTQFPKGFSIQLQTCP